MSETGEGEETVVSEIESSDASTSADKVRLVDLAEDTIGFGETEWHTFRDLLIRPRVALEAYLKAGPTGGGRYKRPLGFYIALCGVLTFYMFLLGGFKGLIEAQPEGSLAPWLERAGSSREAFVNDVDGWMSLLATPILSLFYAGISAPFLIWWSGLDRRKGLRATFVLLNVWTIPIVLLGPLPFLPLFQGYAGLFFQLVFVISFLRVGEGLWFQTWLGGIAKGLLLCVVLLIGAVVGMQPVLYLSLAGASLAG